LREASLTKFSIIFEGQTEDETREGDYKVFHEMVDQVMLAEEFGFDTVWAVEHTSLSNYAHMSAPETFLAYIAGRTTRIGIGHGVVCLMPNMNHPIKVAERIATLDILSKGRVHFGVGKGGSQQEAGAFGYDLTALQPLIDESMYLIPRFFMEDIVEHDGKHIKIPPRPVHPKPFQDPHPPIYMATTKPETLVMAGSRGLGALVLGFGGPDDIKEKSRLYREAFRNRKPEDQVGHRPLEHIAALCPTLVLEDGDLARKIGVRGQRYFYESLDRWYRGGPKPDPKNWGADIDEKGQIVTRFASEEVRLDIKKPSDSIRNPNQSFGNSDDCIAYVQRLIHAGADEILFCWQMGTVPHWAQMETIRQIGRYVIPHFRARSSKEFSQPRAVAAE
jgi:alkanesulfonate monooxygenase SsuD/methylene tetrahydromethanopterin reductase-like flavin-dependent oxidoreductase (luciferase family)